MAKMKRVTEEKINTLHSLYKDIMSLPNTSSDKATIVLGRDSNSLEGLLAVLAKNGRAGYSTLCSDAYKLVKEGLLPPVWRLPAPTSGSMDLQFVSENINVVISRDISSNNNEEFTFPLHGSDWCMLRVITQGVVDEGVDSEPEQLKYNCSFLSFSDDIEWRFSLSPKPFSNVIVFFKVKYILEKFDFKGSLRKLLSLTDESNRVTTNLVSVPISSAISKLAHSFLELDNNNIVFPLLLESKSLEILALSLAALQTESQGENTRRLKQKDIQSLNAVKEKLSNEYATHINQEELSRWAGLNRRKLTEGFKSLFGSTVYEYLLVQRMYQAKLLLDKGETIAAISEKVGYSEQGSFSRAFKRYYGVSPRNLD